METQTVRGKGAEPGEGVVRGIKWTRGSEEVEYIFWFSRVFREISTVERVSDF